MPLPGARQAPLFPEPVAAADAPGAPRAKSAPEASVAPTASSATPASREPGSSQGSPFTSSGLMHMRHSASPPFAQARMLADGRIVRLCLLTFVSESACVINCDGF
jgi:hypothetical protein